jgi:hypothetical protein
MAGPRGSPLGCSSCAPEREARTILAQSMDRLSALRALAGRMPALHYLTVRRFEIRNLELAFPKTV